MVTDPVPQGKARAVSHSDRGQCRSRHRPAGRMLGHYRGLAADFRKHLWIVQIRHPMLYQPQPLRALAVTVR